MGSAGIFIGGMESGAPAVAMRGITKRFGAVVALDNVDLTVRPGTIHALVGENGAGKTTLMKVLYGAHLPTEGTYTVDGVERRFRRSAEAIKAGIGMVSQHYSIIPELTCLQNLMLGAEPGWAIDGGKAQAMAEELAKRMGFQFDWNAEARGLSPAGAQKLEILKLLWRRSRIMILDEPTAMLTPQDSDALYASLKQLVADGATVIVVTHRLPEVLEFCDDVTVLRGGKFITAKPVSQTNGPELAELIVGHAVEIPSPREHDVSANPVILNVSDLTVLGDRGDEAVKSASFRLKAGEIVGIAGVDGSGQRELYQALYGTKSARQGSISFLEKPVPSSVRGRLDAGIQWIPEDRHSEAVVEDWSLIDNAALTRQGSAPFAEKGWVSVNAKAEAAGEIAERFNTKHGGTNQPMGSLSGGNQQRFVNGRALYRGPKLILAFQPARGLDIDATRLFYQALAEQTQAGAAALIVSFDLDELLTYCDRIIVMNGGKLSVPPAEKERDRTEIGRLMVGAA